MIHRSTATTALSASVPLPPEPLELEACYRYCEALAHAHHHNFPIASIFARSALRPHIYAIYAFARIADDFADEAAYEGRRAHELDRWESELHACYFGEPPSHPVYVALAHTIKSFQLPITEFSALLAGMRMDLEQSRYTTFGELRAYAEKAAAPIGHLMLYLGGYRAPSLHAYVDDLATGLALAKLLQDLVADDARGRCYVPAEDLRHFGVTADDIHQHRHTAAMDALIRYEVARARALFARARPLVDEVGSDLAIELALIWHGGIRILDKIERLGGRLLHDRPRIDSVDKARVVLAALAWRGDTAVPRLRDRLRRLH